jgi:hypothetical protein
MHCKKVEQKKPYYQRPTFMAFVCRRGNRRDGARADMLTNESEPRWTTIPTSSLSN